MGAQAAAWGKRIRRHLEDACKALVLEIDKELLRVTPVDTGHARANWIPSVGTPHLEEVGGTSSATHDSGVSAVLSFKLGGGVLYISNVVPYIMRLNYGHSTQAPRLFIEASVDRAVIRIEKQFNVDLRMAA